MIATLRVSRQHKAKGRLRCVIVCALVSVVPHPLYMRHPLLVLKLRLYVHFVHIGLYCLYNLKYPLLCLSALALELVNHRSAFKLIWAISLDSSLYICILLAVYNSVLPWQPLIDSIL